MVKSENGNGKRGPAYYMKLVAAAFALVVIGWQADDRFFTKTEAKVMEHQMAMSLQEQRQETYNESDKRQHEYLLKEKRRLKREMRNAPNDENLQEEYSNVLDDIRRIKDRLDAYRDRPRDNG